MCNDKRCSALHQKGKRLLYSDLSSCINGACGFVQYKHRRLCKHYSCYAQKLLLTFREVISALRDKSVIAVFEPFYKAVSVSRLCRLNYLLACGVRFSVSYIVKYCAGKQPGVLKNHSESGTQRVARDRGYIYVVYVNFTAGDIVESH